MSFDLDLLVDTKRVLFKKGITLQQYFTFVAHRLILEDEKAKDLLDGAAKFNQESLSREDRLSISKIDSNTFYDLFETQEDGG